MGAALLQLVWSLPILVVAALVMSGRVGSIGAGLGGTLCALLVASGFAPLPFGWSDAALAVVKGVWLTFLVGAVILAGLFFREIVSAQTSDESKPNAGQRRKRLFAACFLIGPFAEAATGFGVGQVAIVALVRNSGLSAVHIVLFALFSQTLVPWGAMANGTMIGAALSGVPPVELGVLSACLTAPLLLAWLAAFWQIASTAKVVAPKAELARETCWVIAIAATLIAANAAVGPEIAAMLALGPLIVLRFWLDERPDAATWRALLRVGVPYAVVILGLAATRAVPQIGATLGSVASFRPSDDTPTFALLLHPGTWLILVGVATAFWFGRHADIGPAAKRAWLLGNRAVLAIGLYLVMAQVMRVSGMAAELAKGAQLLLGPSAILATPLLGGAFGFLTGSSNAANGLLMSSQAALATQNHLSVAWVAALQSTAAAALTMLSPVRVTMGCALAESPGLERAVYRRAWPLGAIALVLLTLAAGMVLVLA